MNWAVLSCFKVLRRWGKVICFGEKNLGEKNSWGSCPAAIAIGANEHASHLKNHQRVADLLRRSGISEGGGLIKLDHCNSYTLDETRQRKLEDVINTRGRGARGSHQYGAIAVSRLGGGFQSSGTFHGR
ncbi:hypothetical protein EVAR_59513_1 [Eumeta japonica]|uniref:Uncharacterized protein n=1 Tax=Eumeta variegata TaxID=151549 RepID=A0A4C1XS85_EUMVA|nr:hypothetical protein EVAR_59513_1 [Eumeta japonica]